MKFFYRARGRAIAVATFGLLNLGLAPGALACSLCLEGNVRYAFPFINWVIVTGFGLLVANAWLRRVLGLPRARNGAVRLVLRFLALVVLTLFMLSTGIVLWLFVRCAASFAQVVRDVRSVRTAGQRWLIAAPTLMAVTTVIVVASITFSQKSQMDGLERYLAYVMPSSKLYYDKATAIGADESFEVERLRPLLQHPSTGPCTKALLILTERADIADIHRFREEILELLRSRGSRTMRETLGHWIRSVGGPELGDQAAVERWIELHS